MTGCDRGLRAPVCDRPLREAEHRLEEADGRVPDGELCRVHAHREAAGAGIAVVTGERDLAALVEGPSLGQCERMRGNHQAPQQLATQC